MLKFFRFNRKSDVQDVELKVALPVPDSEIKPTVDIEPQAADPSAIVEKSAFETGLPQEAPENPEPKVLGQMETIKAIREDVIAAYKIFLGRLPESMEVVDPRVGVSPSAILLDFLISKEFLDQASKSQLILALAKKILDERKQVSPPDKEMPSELGLRG